MKPLFFFGLVYILSSNALIADDRFIEPLSLEQFIEIGLQNSAEVQKANAKVDEYRARLKEVQANYYPKLHVLSYVAPMFTVEGDAFENHVDRRFDLGSWGPSTHLEALLAMPIYTFGRIEAGEQAAQARLAVENARLREAENLLKVEIRKFYYTHLYAQTIIPHLQKADELLDDVEVKAKELYESASGKVTKADLMKLNYGRLTLKKFMLQAEEGVDLALGALKHTIGVADDQKVSLIEKKLPTPPRKFSLLEEIEMQNIALQHRPEWEQVRQGLKAASSLRQSEKLSNRPILFVAGSLEADWTPTRDDATNPYHYDPYNEVFGGVAIGFKLDLDWALRKAKIDQAQAKLQEVNALKKLATTGIPMQIKKARSNLKRYSDQAKLSKKAQKAANKWIIFSVAAYESGTGEVKEILEGLVALLQAKRDLYESYLNFYIAQAELNYALGRDVFKFDSTKQ